MKTLLLLLLLTVSGSISVQSSDVPEESGLKFNFTAAIVDNGIQVSCDVLNTSGRDICFLTSTCAGYQDALLYNEDQLEMLKMYCNISRPVIKKIEPGKTYHFNVLFTKKAELSKLELGFEMKIVDNVLYDKTLDWDSYKNIESKKVVLGNTIELTNSN